jgi:hypothetical protein
MKHVVSVSLGSSKRNTHQEIELLDQRVLIERRGTDGDIDEAARVIRELDGNVDALGLGGIDLYVYVGGKRYAIRDAQKLARNAKVTPVVCGAGLKDTLERRVVEQLSDEIQWSGRKVLMVSALDRFGMAEALVEAGAKVLYGDAIFSLGWPVPIRSLTTLRVLAQVLNPVALRLPFRWLYPVGAKQEVRVRGWRERYYDEAEVIAGDFHFINRYAPDRLEGKVILTNTTTSADIEDLRSRGVKTLITTTPRYNGRSLATNFLEACFVAVSEQFPLSSTEYRELISQAGLGPNVLQLNP